MGLRHVLSDPVALTDVDGNALGVTGTALDTTLATAIAGEDATNDVLKTEQQFTYLHLSATTTIPATFLHRIIINSAAATASIAVTDGGTALSTWVPGALTVPVSVEFNVNLNTSCVVTITVAAADVTVVYR